MKMRKVISWTLLLLFLCIQLIRPRRNNDGKIAGASFIQLYDVPDSLNQLLQVTCYDCHSNHTQYPWYSNIQPVGWILAGHIRKGKAKVNFSEFPGYSRRRQVSKLKEIANQIEDDEMPLKSYRLFHSMARLSGEKKKWVINWMRNKADSISHNEQ